MKAPFHESFLSFLGQSFVALLTMSPQDHSTERLAELCQLRLEKLQVIRELSIQQCVLAQSQDVERLLSLAGKRQHALDALESIQSELRTYSNEDPERRVWASPELREKCRVDLEKGKSILSELIVMEQRSIDILASQREAIAEQIHLHHGTQTVLNAYSSQLHLPSASGTYPTAPQLESNRDPVAFAEIDSEFANHLSLEG